MVIKVYISQPYSDKRSVKFGDIVDRLYAMVNGTKIGFDFVSAPRRAVPTTAFDDLSKDISNLEKADFVIFDENWQLDKRCLIEDEIVVRYGIPYCRIEDLETFFKNYIFGAFKFDKPNNL